MTSLSSSHTPSPIPDDEVDFVLVWDECGFNEATKLRAANRRTVFERNLRSEGLLVEREINENTGEVNFVKIHVPHDVLKNYADVLKLRLPLKKFKRVTELPDEGEDGIFNRFLARFRLNPAVFPPKADEFTAIFSKDKEFLFDLSRPDLFTPSLRSRIIEFILKRKSFSDDNEFDFGMERALAERIYVAAFPLHIGSLKATGSMRQNLYSEWASLTKMLKFQPLDAVRDYYGVKIGFYYAWLGFYIVALIPPSIVGIIVVIYGLASMTSDKPSQDICAASDIIICPECDRVCEYSTLSDLCGYSMGMHVFDNGATVFFAVFISLWAVIYRQMWKRYSSEIAYRWGVMDFAPEEEHPRPQFLARLNDVHEVTKGDVSQKKEPKISWRDRAPGLVTSVSMVLFMIFVSTAAVVGVIIYRMAMVVTIHINHEFFEGRTSIIISLSAALINLIGIAILELAYTWLAVWLTEMELHRTQTEYDDSLTFKIYALQFVNYYASIFYIAFFKGRIIGHPGNYITLAGYRLEECQPGGCFIELVIQLAVIFAGKQIWQAFVENVIGPFFGRLWSKMFFESKSMKKTKLRALAEGEAASQWRKDILLANYGALGLFYEYLEMVIQYGFLTIFATAFPLAPLCALVNNLFEIRLDAKKLLCNNRRPVAERVGDIGIWLNIIDGLGEVAVVSTGLIIAFTSEFIPKAVYQIVYSPNGDLSGYTKFSLSRFDPLDLENGTTTPGANLPNSCYYHDFRYPPNDPQEYQLTRAYWQIMAARFICVLVYIVAVGFSAKIIRWCLPEMKKELTKKIKREAYIFTEAIIKHNKEEEEKELDATDDDTDDSRRRKLDDVTDTINRP